METFELQETGNTLVKGKYVKRRPLRVRVREWTAGCGASLR